MAAILHVIIIDDSAKLDSPKSFIIIEDKHFEELSLLNQYYGARLFEYLKILWKG